MHDQAKFPEIRPPTVSDPLLTYRISKALENFQIRIITVKTLFENLKREKKY